MSPAPALAVSSAEPGCSERAGRLARELGLPLLSPDLSAVDCADRFAALLQLAPDGLALLQTGPGAPGPVRIDFGSAAMRHRRRAGHNELLGRAVGWRRERSLRVLDATAGLARDAFVLADLGCEVRLCERHPAIAALLQDALTRAAADDDPWLRERAARMQLLPGDAREGRGARDVDVICLDPMFPERRKSAAVKKEMALFHLLLGVPEDESDGAELLHWALQQDVARVVVKRPPRAPLLGGRKPSHQLGGKAVRFDVHVLRALPSH